MNGTNGSTTNGATTNGSARGGTEVRILTMAASLFAQFGYNGVSTREIAAAAEVNEVTIYRHFPRKRDLYLAVLSTELQRVHLQGDLLTRLAGAESGRQALTCTFELLATALRQPQLVRLLSFSVLEISEDLDPLLRRHLGELLEVIARYLQPWIERGEIRCANAKTLVLTLTAIVLSRGPLKRVFTGETADMTSLFETYAEFCLAEPMPGGVTAYA
ncbi:MAG TPA: TetR/AcrR family transcriptional regulator [Terracidiphilus sp.]|nr:TetR/AcrR family transcriptional regulator [Terracidiphilus sp.]